MIKVHNRSCSHWHVVTGMNGHQSQLCRSLSPTSLPPAANVHLVPPTVILLAPPVWDTKTLVRPRVAANCRNLTLAYLNSLQHGCMGWTTPETWGSVELNGVVRIQNNKCIPIPQFPMSTSGWGEKNKKVFVFTPSNVLNYTLSNAIILFCPGNPNNERTVFLINDVNADWVCLWRMSPSLEKCVFRDLFMRSYVRSPGPSCKPRAGESTFLLN